MNINRSQLKAQYDRAVKLGWVPFFQEAADTITAGYFDAADLMGIGSRETNLDPKWLKQLGDGGMAGGLMQADKRSFPEFITSGKWKDAEQSIIFGAKVLMLKWTDYEQNIGKRLSVKGNAYTAQEAEGVTAQHLVIASYNCGRWSQYCLAKGRDLDSYTTGKDYGADVMQRAAIFREFLQSESAQDASNASAEASTSESKNEPANDPQSAPVPPIPDAVPVQTVAAEPQSAVDTTLTKWSARFTMIPSAILTAAAGIWTWATSAPAHLVETLFIIFGSIVTVYIALEKTFKYFNAKHDRDIQEAREQRAHETQLALIASAANKGANTVALVPPPVVEQNSDQPDPTETK